MPLKVNDTEFIAAFQRYGSPSKVASVLGLKVVTVFQRRNRLERRGVLLPTATTEAKIAVRTKSFEQRRSVQVKDGCVVVFSDAHYWPGDPSLAHLALLELCRSLKPKLVVANGDLLDGATISRHEPRGWLRAPDVREEVEVLQERLAEIRNAAPKSELLRTLGNHCIRFERHLAVHAPQYRGLAGTSLEDHIPEWPCSWTVEVNDTIVKHRWAGGIHAAYNNTLKSGRSIVTGHLHSLKCTPYTDYDGIRFGVDTGTLADPYHDAFDYAEDNPRDWRSGFVVLTYKGGKLLWPETCYVDDGVAYFRGEVVS